LDDSIVIYLAITVLSTTNTTTTTRRECYQRSIFIMSLRYHGCRV